MRKNYQPFVVWATGSKVYHKPAPLPPDLHFPKWWLAKYRFASCTRYGSISGFKADEGEQAKLGHRRCRRCWPESRRTG